jgi:hypothetical protein
VRHLGPSVRFSGVVLREGYNSSRKFQYSQSDKYLNFGSCLNEALRTPPDDCETHVVRSDLVPVAAELVPLYLPKALVQLGGLASAQNDPPKSNVFPGNIRDRVSPFARAYRAAVEQRDELAPVIKKTRSHRTIAQRVGLRAVAAGSGCGSSSACRRHRNTGGSARPPRASAEPVPLKPTGINISVTRRIRPGRRLKHLLNFAV